MREATDDRVLYWPTVLAVAWPVIFGLVLNGPSILILLLVHYLVLLMWLVSGVFGLATCIIWAYERTWRRLLSTSVLPLTVLLAGLNLDFIWWAARSAGYYFYLFVV